MVRANISRIMERLTCCCQHHSYKISNTPTETTTTTTPCQCQPDTINNTTKLIDNRTVSEEPINLSESNLSRSRINSETPSQIFSISTIPTDNLNSHNSGESTTPARLGRLHTIVFHRRTMFKVLFYSVIVLIVCLCGGVVMLNHSEDPPGYKGRVHKLPKSGINEGYKGNSEESNIFKDVPYKSVPVEVFEKHLAETRSVPDIMRIFLDRPNLTDDQVNSILYMKSHSVLYGKREFRSRDVMNDRELADDTGNGEEWTKQYQEFKESPLGKCSEPKPVLVRVNEQEHGAILTYLPPCAIVHRCSSDTGCCPHGKECKPREKNGIEIIDKHFMVLKRTFGENGETVTPYQRLFAAKSFINHTACECQSTQVLSNCMKKCPRQFRSSRTGVNCDCVCRDANRKCQSIQRGIRPLDERDLECIKKNECIVPKCKKGRFNIKSGFCPFFRRHKRQKAG